MTTKPTQAAMRAAKGIMDTPPDASLNELSKIIDRETGLSDLLAACKALLIDSACPLGEQKRVRYSVACDMARKAIAKAESD